MEDKTTVNWGLTPRGIYTLPLEYAAATGVFGKELEIRFHYHETGAQYGTKLKAGTYDIGQIGTPVYFPAVAETNEYEIVTIGICNYPPFYLVAEPGVCSLPDLRGFAVAINKRKTCIESLLLWHAHEAGVNEDELKLMELMTTADDEPQGPCAPYLVAFSEANSANYGERFIKGAKERRFKAGVINEPFVTYMQTTAGWKIIGDYPRIISPSNYCLLLYVRKTWARRHPEVKKRLVSDYFRAIRFARDHIEEMLRVVAPLPHISNSQLLAVLHREAPLWNTAPLLDYAVFDRACDEMKRQGRLLENYRPLIFGEQNPRVREA